MGYSQISKIKQTEIYIGKCFRIFQNEKGWKIFISAAIITILIASVTGSGMFEVYQDTKNGAFALICACIWIGIFNSIQSICKERDIIKREYRSGLSISSYVSAHLVFEMALCLVESLIVILVVGVTNINTLPSNGVFLPTGFELYVTFFLIILASDALALMISCIVKTASTAMTVMPFVLIIQLVMSGMIFELQGITSIISNLTISKWGLNAICVTANLNEMAVLISSDYEYSIAHLSQLWFLLIIFIAVYTIIAIFFLKRVDKDKR